MQNIIQLSRCVTRFVYAEPLPTSIVISWYRNGECWTFDKDTGILYYVDVDSSD